MSECVRVPWPALCRDWVGAVYRYRSVYPAALPHEILGACGCCRANEYVGLLRAALDSAGGVFGILVTIRDPHVVSGVC